MIFLDSKNNSKNFDEDSLQGHLGKRIRTKNLGLGFFNSDTISSDAPNFQIINDTKVQIILQKQ